MGTKDEADGSFEAYRRIIEHEDGLVDKRIAWLLAFNGLLFAAYGLSLSAEIVLQDLNSNDVTAWQQSMSERIETLRQAISFAGLLSCFAALIGVSAAMRAIAYTKNDYSEVILGSNGERLKGKLVAIAGSRKTFLWGMVYGLAMPPLVAVPWSYLILTTNVLGADLDWELRALVASIGPFLALLLAICTVKCAPFDNARTPHLRHAAPVTPDRKETTDV